MVDVDCILGLNTPTIMFDKKIEGDGKYVDKKIDEIKQILKNYRLQAPHMVTFNPVHRKGPYIAVCWETHNRNTDVCAQCIYNTKIKSEAVKEAGAEVAAVLKDSVSA